MKRAQCKHCKTSCRDYASSVIVPLMIVIDYDNFTQTKLTGDQISITKSVRTCIRKNRNYSADTKSKDDTNCFNTRSKRLCLLSHHALLVCFKTPCAGIIFTLKDEEEYFLGKNKQTIKTICCVSDLDGNVNKANNRVSEVVDRQYLQTAASLFTRGTSKDE